MAFPPIKRGDMFWIMLTTSICFVIGAILFVAEFTFIIMYVGAGDWFQDDERPSIVRYQQNAFDCADEVHRGNVEHSRADHERDPGHEKICAEMRRIAESIVSTAVEKYHPRPDPDPSVDPSADRPN